MITNNKMTIEEKYNDVCKALNSISVELEVYKKAYELLSMAYCDKGDCWEKCECYEQCRRLGDYGVDITKELFLQKASDVL